MNPFFLSWTNAFLTTLKKKKHTTTRDLNSYVGVASWISSGGSGPENKKHSLIHFYVIYR